MKQYHAIAAILCLFLMACGNPNEDPIDVEEVINETESLPEEPVEAQATASVATGNAGMDAVAAETKQGTYRDMADGVTEEIKNQADEAESYFEVK